MDEDTLAEIAAQLVGRVRDDGPDDNARWLTNKLPNPTDWFRLAFALAAAVPDDVPWSVLTNWTHAQDRGENRGLRPHGTAAAVARHGRRKEPLCALCRAVERERKARSRAA